MATDALRVGTGIFVSLMLLLAGWSLQLNHKLKIVGWVLVVLGVVGFMVILRFIANY